MRLKLGVRLASGIFLDLARALQTWALARCARAALWLMRHGSLHLSMGAAKEFDETRAQLQSFVGELSMTWMDRVRLAWGFRRIRAEQRRRGIEPTRIPWAARLRMRFASALWKLKWWWRDRVEEARGSLEGNG